MAPRQVVDGRAGLLNLRAAMIEWGEEDGEGGRGTVTHLRWMMPPQIGLPVNPFQVWSRFDEGGLTKQELANSEGWTLLETVGLPVFDGWEGGQHYRGWEQGLEPPPLTTPRKAAEQRLQRGAPRHGWAPHSLGGRPLPRWEPTDPDSYLTSIEKGKLLAGLGRMLAEEVPASQQISFALDEKQAEPIVPTLLQGGPGWPLREGEEAKSSWRPMELLAIAAASDPLAALALGYGTAFDTAEGELLYMVTVVHATRPDLAPVELADIARVGLLEPRSVARPAGLHTLRAGFTKPQQTDGAATESVAVAWHRPLVPEPVPLAFEEPLTVSYALGQSDPASADAPNLLLQQRPDGVGGYLAYVPAYGTESGALCRYTDHVTRDGSAVTGFSRLYAVAAQDLYGRWSRWVDTDYDGAPEEPRIPSVLSIAISSADELVVDFSWDWTDRSPARIELLATLAGTAVTIGTEVAFNSDGSANDAEIAPLTPDRAVSIGGWGKPQDRIEGSPGVRLYRWTRPDVIIVPPRGRSIDLSVSARGQCRLHFDIDPDWNVSQWSRPKTTRLWDDTPPDPPQLETPRWTSLPDAGGVSRFDMKWRADATAERGYFVYEATETAVREALGIAPADLAVPIVTRLNALLNSPAADFAAKADALRKTFRRITSEPLPAGQLHHEVALPRGSKVLHFLTVTSIGGNGVESPWPTDRDAYSIVAVPRLVVPPVPSIALSVAPGGTGIAARVQLASPGGVVELYRLQRDAAPLAVDAMGPPQQVRQVAGDSADFIDQPPRGWKKLWYGAIVKSVPDDAMGLVSGRSPASGIFSVLLPPGEAAQISDLAVNGPQSTPTESLASWRTTAPLAPTPLGSHIVVVELRDTAAGAIAIRVEQALDAIPPLPPVVAGLGLPAEIRLFTTRDGTGSRLSAWLPRAEGQTRHLTVKIIDPLGRLNTRALDVPPIVSTPIDWLATVQNLRGRNGERFYFSFGAMPPGAPHQIWGTDIYTDDSPVAVAAVHAGKVTAAGGRVCVEILPGRESYAASSRNGITSETWDVWEGSYRFV